MFFSKKITGPVKVWAPRITFLIGKDVIFRELYSDRDEAMEIAVNKAGEKNAEFADEYSVSGGTAGLNRAFGDVLEFDWSGELR